MPPDSRHHGQALPNTNRAWRRLCSCKARLGHLCKEEVKVKVAGQVATSFPAAESRGLGCLPGWVGRGVSLSDPSTPCAHKSSPLCQR